jgi:uncharacterized membrane protein
MVDAPVQRPDLDSPSLVTSMTHLYRGEMNRLTVWRQRLDVTSNWAIILTTGLATFTLGDPGVPHYTLLLGIALIWISIVIEGRRYRHLHHSKWRVYLLEFGYFAELLNPLERTEALPDWRRILAADLRHRHFLIDRFTAIRVRLRRNYLFLLLLLTAVWVVKLFIHPARPGSVAELYARLTVGGLIPSWFVAATALGFVVGTVLLGLSSPPAERIEDWSAHYVRLAGRETQAKQPVPGLN